MPKQELVGEDGRQAEAHPAIRDAPGGREDLVDVSGEADEVRDDELVAQGSSDQHDVLVDQPANEELPRFRIDLSSTLKGRFSHN